MKKKIIVIDDNPDVLYTVKHGLEGISTDYEVEGIINPDECFERMKEGNIPDIILLDIMMPKINGWDLLARIRNDTNWDTVPVLFLTAKNDDLSKGLGTLTSSGYITKPFEVDALKSKIDEILGGK